MVAVERLDHPRVAEAAGTAGGLADRLGPLDPLDRFDRFVGVVDPHLARHRQAEVGEDLVGEAFVGRDLDRRVASLAGDRRLDAALELAVAELHQRAVVEADPRDVALLGGPHQRAGRGAEGAALRQAHQGLAFAAEIERRRVVGRALRRQEMADHRQAERAGGGAHRLLGEAVDHVVLAGGQGLAASLAIGDWRTSQALELDRHVLEHVAEPGALVLAQPADEAARLAVRARVLVQGRHQLEQPLVEPGQAQRRVGFELSQVHPQSDHRPERVEVGSAVDPRLEDLHRRAGPPRS